MEQRTELTLFKDKGQTVAILGNGHGDLSSNLG